MCLPAPAGDPERYRLKLRNMAAVVPSFRAAGCDALIMPGHLGLDPALSSRTVDGADLTACRAAGVTGRTAALADAAAVRRIWWRRRSGMPPSLDRSSFADACVDTDGLTVAEVARLVRERGRRAAAGAERSGTGRSGRRAVRPRAPGGERHGGPAARERGRASPPYRAPRSGPELAGTRRSADRPARLSCAWPPNGRWTKRKHSTNPASARPPHRHRRPISARGGRPGRRRLASVPKGRQKAYVVTAHPSLGAGDGQEPAAVGPDLLDVGEPVVARAGERGPDGCRESSGRC